jgi:hypothetical protein
MSCKLNDGISWLCKVRLKGLEIAKGIAQLGVRLRQQSDGIYSIDPTRALPWTLVNDKREGTLRLTTPAIKGVADLRLDFCSATSFYYTISSSKQLESLSKPPLHKINHHNV